MNLPITTPVMVNPPPLGLNSGVRATIEWNEEVRGRIVWIDGEVSRRSMSRADWLRLRQSALEQGDIIQFNEANAALGM